jgi:methylphosphotriester-DNA--protein-cysteine methyltransferase
MSQNANGKFIIILFTIVISSLNNLQPEKDIINNLNESSYVRRHTLFVGNSQLNKYHKLNCYWAKQINPENKVFFRSTNHAENFNYQACQVCLKSSLMSISEIFVGSKYSIEYHKINCYWARRINPENKIYFVSKNDAASKGYMTCVVCNPPMV